MRKRLYDIIEPHAKASKLSNIYDISMIVIILLSFLPLIFKVEPVPVRVIDAFCVIIFCIDYILRWITADYRLESKGKNRTGAAAFASYPFTAMAIVDLLTILPSLIALNPAFRALRIMRLLRALRVLRVVKIFRYSKIIARLKRVFYAQRHSFLVVMVATAAYIVMIAMVMFQAEPEIFGNFLDALYWSAVSITTIGYGDIVPATAIGKTVTIISALVGIVVIALPAGIFTAGYVEELKREDEEAE